ncbi:bifunctional riboflavin kinase/FAD synthetase [Geminocystis sp. NIES-3709]|uniref:bifunctional riboflavin kinase/FAD synthetase n=1 Tax=Geminocystis sp. NIES-3709 TaxID=1617448 RepID=UPI0005FC476B|nr:bifunctional riboflavin kinase/FAD synthetase [Geminocystis sp. NIES-3709]BAQ65359.1 riboflavin kinase [Geminocystis sp. NIES-3709]
MVLKIITTSLNNILQDNITITGSCSIALGNFDGIHKGHQQVIQPIFDYPDSTPSLVTFIPHPEEFFTGTKKLLLTPIPEKCRILEQLGVEQLILLPFDQELAHLSPEEFINKILIKYIKAQFISVGEDFRFGYQRQGNAEYLQILANKYDVKVSITKEQNLTINQESIRISSSYIRESLESGKTELAKEMLGREYQICGKVIEGKKLGRQIGFPTANLEVVPEKFLPKIGVYIVKVGFDNKNYWGVMNIGKRPTIDGKNISIEVHLLDFNGNLYHKNLTLKLIKFLRSEQKFSSLDELKTQIQLDTNQAFFFLEHQYSLKNKM